jgi:hypothetical protein
MVPTQHGSAELLKVDILFRGFRRLKLCKHSYSYCTEEDPCADLVPGRLLGERRWSVHLRYLHTCDGFGRTNVTLFQTVVHPYDKRDLKPSNNPPKWHLLSRIPTN